MFYREREKRNFFKKKKIYFFLYLKITVKQVSTDVFYRDFLRLPSSKGPRALSTRSKSGEVPES